MKELKTLKELGMYGFNKCKRCKIIGERCGICHNQILKKEAIKQIILLQMLKLEYGLIRFIKRIQINAKIKWIKWFFNIDEDLK